MLFESTTVTALFCIFSTVSGVTQNVGADLVTDSSPTPQASSIYNDEANTRLTDIAICKHASLCRWRNAPSASAQGRRLAWHTTLPEFARDIINYEDLLTVQSAKNNTDINGANDFKNYAVAATLMGDRSPAERATAALVSDIIPCQNGNGQLIFNYYTSPLVVLKVCTRHVANSTILIATGNATTVKKGKTQQQPVDFCQNVNTDMGPGPANITIPSANNSFFEIYIIAYNYIYVHGGFAMIGKIHYDANFCYATKELSAPIDQPVPAMLFDLPDDVSTYEKFLHHTLMPFDAIRRNTIDTNSNSNNVVTSKPSFNKGVAQSLPSKMPPQNQQNTNLEKQSTADCDSSNAVTTISLCEQEVKRITVAAEMTVYNDSNDNKNAETAERRNLNELNLTFNNLSEQNLNEQVNAQNVRIRNKNTSNGGRTIILSDLKSVTSSVDVQFERPQIEISRERPNNNFSKENNMETNEKMPQSAPLTELPENISKNQPENAANNKINTSLPNIQPSSSEYNNQEVNISDIKVVANNNKSSDAMQTNNQIGDNANASLNKEVTEYDQILKKETTQIPKKEEGEVRTPSNRKIAEEKAKINFEIVNEEQTTVVQSIREEAEKGLEVNSASTDNYDNSSHNLHHNLSIPQPIKVTIVEDLKLENNSLEITANSFKNDVPNINSLNQNDVTILHKLDENSDNIDKDSSGNDPNSYVENQRTLLDDPLAGENGKGQRKPPSASNNTDTINFQAPTFNEKDTYVKTNQPSASSSPINSPTSFNESDFNENAISFKVESEQPDLEINMSPSINETNGKLVEYTKAQQNVTSLSFIDNEPIVPTNAAFLDENKNNNDQNIEIVPTTNNLTDFENKDITTTTVQVNDDVHHNDEKNVDVGQHSTSTSNPNSKEEAFIKSYETNTVVSSQMTQQQQTNDTESSIELTRLKDDGVVSSTQLTSIPESQPIASTSHPESSYLPKDVIARLREIFSQKCVDPNTLHLSENGTAQLAVVNSMYIYADVPGKLPPPRQVVANIAAHFNDHNQQQQTVLGNTNTRNIEAAIVRRMRNVVG